MKNHPHKPEISVQIEAIASNQLLSDIRALIENSRSRVSQAVNTELVLLYWHIGRRIRSEIIGEGRAEYGKRVVETLSSYITLEYGKGFSRRNLFNMIHFAEIFPNEQIVQTLSAQLAWSHFGSSADLMTTGLAISYKGRYGQNPFTSRLSSSWLRKPYYFRYSGSPGC